MVVAMRIEEKRNAIVAHFSHPRNDVPQREQHLQRVLATLVSSAGRKRVIIDFTGVESVPQSIVSSLLAIDRDNIYLRNIPRGVFEISASVCLSRAFPIGEGNFGEDAFPDVIGSVQTAVTLLCRDRGHSDHQLASGVL